MSLYTYVYPFLLFDKTLLTLLINIAYGPGKDLPANPKFTISRPKISSIVLAVHVN